MAKRPAPAPDEATLGFRETLHGLTPRAWVTPALIALNLGLFVFHVINGAHIMSPSSDVLIAEGANYGPLTTQGDWWRLLTSTFIHIGVIHVAMNMVVLAQIGMVVERLVGNLPFLLLYLVAGVLASLTSVAWNPGVVSAGASGAVFGCYGLFLGLVLRNRANIPAAVRTQMLKGAGAFLAYNVLYGLGMSGLDQAAHVGGLVVGFLAGLVVALPLTPAGVRKRLPMAALVAVVAAGAGFAGARAIPVAADWMGEFQSAVAVEKAANTRIEAAQAGAKAGTTSDAEFARTLREEVLPPWNGQRDRLLALSGQVKGPIRERVDALGQYMKLRGHGFELMAEALETQNLALIAQAEEAFKAANAIMEKYR